MLKLQRELFPLSVQPGHWRMLRLVLLASETMRAERLGLDVFRLKERPATADRRIRLLKLRLLIVRLALGAMMSVLPVLERVVIAREPERV